ncbi:MAG: HAMP domain-containing histidine kinase, partial [Alphaproteobacteria bacterium]|nr:HAMP domain-containing histidine kinase [Alphaproteobacteria bacterium]
GKAITLTSTVQDITDRKKIDQMKNEFISTVNHELRTPLTSIHGSLGLLKGNVAGELPEKAKGMITIAYRNSDRLISLINDLLDIEKIATGKMDFHLEQSDLSELMTKTVEANQSYAEQFGTKIVVTSNLEKAVATIDPRRVEQVIANLLSNASKFSPEGKDIEIALSKEGNKYRIAVTDYGPGVPEEFRGHIFNRFTQVDSTDTRQKGGTGLGLAICKEIITQMGGQIDYRNRDEGGATFWFGLPVA